MDEALDAQRADTEAVRARTEENRKNGHANRTGFLTSVYGNVLTPLACLGAAAWAGFQGHDMGAAALGLAAIAAISPRIITAARGALSTGEDETPDEEA